MDGETLKKMWSVYVSKCQDKSGKDQQGG